MFFDFLYNHKIRGLKPTKYKQRNIFKWLLKKYTKPAFNYQTRTNIKGRAILVKTLFNFKIEMRSHQVAVFVNVSVLYKTMPPKTTMKKIHDQINNAWAMVSTYTDFT